VEAPDAAGALNPFHRLPVSSASKRVGQTENENNYNSMKFNKFSFLEVQTNHTYVKTVTQQSGSMCISTVCPCQWHKPKNRLTNAIVWITTKPVQLDVIAPRTNKLHLISHHQLQGTEPSELKPLLFILSFEWFSSIPFLLLYLLTHAYQQNMKTQMFATNDHTIHCNSVKHT